MLTTWIHVESNWAFWFRHFRTQLYKFFSETVYWLIKNNTLKLRTEGKSFIFVPCLQKKKDMAPFQQMVTISTSINGLPLSIGILLVQQCSSETVNSLHTALLFLEDLGSTRAVCWLGFAVCYSSIFHLERQRAARLRLGDWLRSLLYSVQCATVAHLKMARNAVLRHVKNVTC